MTDEKTASVKVDFEDFLRTEYASDTMTLDDELEDSFGDWLGTLSGEEWLEYGQKYAEEICRKFCQETEKTIPIFERLGMQGEDPIKQLDSLTCIKN